MTCRRSLINLALGGLLLAAGAASAAVAPRDSTVTNLPPLQVTGDQAELPGPDRTLLTVPAIRMQDPGSLADLGGLIPSARVAVNSRGDSHLMIRGAPERHVQTFVAGIPLNLPWDERVDLQSVPIVGTGTITATRGLTTLLDGPGVLAGSVDLHVPGYESGSFHNRIRLVAGDHAFGRTTLQHANRVGPWQVLGALGWHGQQALNLARGVVEVGGSDRRRNSDLSQYSGLWRAGRAVAGTGRLNILATGWSAEKGVPAELNLGDDARFWRYPIRKRGLVGASLQLPLNRSGTWDLSSVVSADFFHQEIDPRGPDNWDTPQVTGQDYEKDWDRTGYGKLGLTHWLTETAELTVQGTARYTHHREILTVGGPTLSYSQWLASVVAEAGFQPVAAWRLRAGLGLDHAATPESGLQPANAPQSQVAWNLRATRSVPGNAELHAAASRRSRAPSLRELYSGALGRFVVNPALRPEQQNLYEVGYTRVSPGWRLEATAFLMYLTDGIEKESLNNPERQFRRVNRTEIRVPGLELAGGWQWANDLSLAWQHTILAARVKTEAGFDQAAEDRPDYLSRLTLDWRPARGPGALLEAVVTGGRWSADATLPLGLQRLPAGVIWNARLAWRFAGPDRTVTLHLRLDNISNSRVDDQVGLPNPGMLLSGGAEIAF